MAAWKETKQVKRARRERAKLKKKNYKNVVYKAARADDDPPRIGPGTHWHEQIKASPRAHADAQWLLDNGWSGKQ